MKYSWILIVLLCGCHFIATGEFEKPKKTVHSKMERAVNVAVLKAFMDPTWGTAEIQKEIKYQLWLQEQDGS